MRNAGLAAVLAAGLMGSGVASAALGGATDDAALTARGQAVVIDVLANDSGIAGFSGMKIQKRPNHGSARIVGGTIHYTPAAGFSGRDQFRYMVNGSNGFGVATVVVHVGDSLVLQGRVVEGPVDGALVTASVDGMEFTTQADSDGNYSLGINPPAGGMVTLHARGVDEQAYVRLASVLGDFNRLAAEAGSDRVLTRAENNQVQVTSLGTAQARLLQAFNGGLPIGDDAQLVAAREGMDHSRLLQQAAAVRLAVSGIYPLPAGTQDTLALISDPAALAQFIASVDAIDRTAVPNAIAEIRVDRDVIVPASLEELTGSHALMFNLGPTGALNMQYVQGLRLTLAADGSGSYVNATPNSDPSVAWAFASGVADVTPNHPIAFQTYRFMPDFRQVRAVLTPVGYQVSKLFEGNGRDTWSLTTTQRYTYPDNPEYPPETVTSSGAALAIKDGVGIEPILASEVVGLRTLWIPDTHTSLPPAASGGSELFGFFPNGTGQRSYGTPQTFTWSIDAQGRLVINVNGDTARFQRLKRDGRAGDGLLGEWLAGNARSAKFSISATVDGSAFDVANAERAWRSGFYIGTSSAEFAGDLAFLLDPARIAWQRNVTTAGQAFSTPLGWRVANGVVEILTYRNGSNQQVHECQVGVNGCRITMIRRWRPVARNGDRIYVIEEFLQDTDGNGTLELSQQRTNFYDEIPRPQLSAAGVGISRPAAGQEAATRLSPTTRLTPVKPQAPRAAPARD